MDFASFPGAGELAGGGGKLVTAEGWHMKVAAVITALNAPGRSEAQAVCSVHFNVQMSLFREPQIYLSFGNI